MEYNTEFWNELWENREIITLTEEDAKVFLDAIECPLKPSPRLVELFKKKSILENNKDKKDGAEK